MYIKCVVLISEIISTVYRQCYSLYIYNPSYWSWCLKTSQNRIAVFLFETKQSIPFQPCFLKAKKPKKNCLDWACILSDVLSDYYRDVKQFFIPGSREAVQLLIHNHVFLLLKFQVSGGGWEEWG